MKSTLVLALLVALPAVAVSQAIDWSPLCGGDTGITCPPKVRSRDAPPADAMLENLGLHRAA